MNKKITEIVINPINPRKISAANQKRLQQSIMLFPKMLSYRDIIINKSNIVLAGNQRTTVLLKILNSSPIDWMLILQENERWLQLTEAEKDKVIDYWKKWCDSPVIKVTELELSDDEEKELIIKDNNEFGEFDYTKLQQIYDEINLINFGFEEALFYNPEDDENYIAKSTLGKGKKTNVLTFGRSTIAVTREEYDMLVSIYEDYVDENGVDFGFIRNLLSNKQ